MRLLILLMIFSFSAYSQFAPPAPTPEQIAKDEAAKKRGLQLAAPIAVELLNTLNTEAEKKNWATGFHQSAYGALSNRYIITTESGNALRIRDNLQVQIAASENKAANDSSVGSVVYVGGGGFEPSDKTVSVSPEYGKHALVESFIYSKKNLAGYATVEKIESSNKDEAPSYQVRYCIVPKEKTSQCAGSNAILINKEYMEGTGKGFNAKKRVQLFNESPIWNVTAKEKENIDKDNFHLKKATTDEAKDCSGNVEVGPRSDKAHEPLDPNSTVNQVIKQ